MSERIRNRIFIFVFDLIIQDEVNNNKLYVSGGVWGPSGNKMEPTVMALDASTGNVLWTWKATAHAGHGGVRSVIVDGSRIICTGYINFSTPGFVFVVMKLKP